MVPFAAQTDHFDIVHLFRNYPDLLESVLKIKAGRGHQDMVLDLLVLPDEELIRPPRSWIRAAKPTIKNLSTDQPRSISFK